MKKHLIVAGLFALGLGSLATSAWIGFARPSTAGPNAGHLQALPVSYRLPNYTGFYSTDVCSGQNLMNPNQRASWNCEGSFGACISCIPPTNAPVSYSGLQNSAGAGSVQPAGGPASSCTVYNEWAGNCTRQNGVYSCIPSVDLQQTCQGTYLDFLFQAMTADAKSPDSVRTGSGVSEVSTNTDIVVIR
jgi:hypothetical protein